MSTMPAVKAFALYAALAILLDFALQMTAFVALLSLDCRRQDNNRCELLCCVKVSRPRPNKSNEGFLLPFMRKYYAPVLLHRYTRILVVKGAGAVCWSWGRKWISVDYILSGVSLQMCVFIFMLCSSIFLLFHVKLGLDQELAMPLVSHINYWIHGHQFHHCLYKVSLCCRTPTCWSILSTCTSTLRLEHRYILWQQRASTFPQWMERMPSAPALAVIHSPSPKKSSTPQTTQSCEYLSTYLNVRSDSTVAQPLHCTVVKRDIRPVLRITAFPWKILEPAWYRNNRLYTRNHPVRSDNDTL